MILPYGYNPFLVVLSVLCAVGASYTALEVADEWALLRGGLESTGFWAVRLPWEPGLEHALLWYEGVQLPAPMGYDVPLMLVSILIAIAASACGLLVASRPVMGRVNLAVGGTFMDWPLRACITWGWRQSTRTPTWDSALCLSCSPLSFQLVERPSRCGWRTGSVRRRTRTNHRENWQRCGDGVLIALAHYSGMAACNSRTHCQSLLNTLSRC